MAIIEKDIAVEQSSKDASEQIEFIDPGTEDLDIVEAGYWMSPHFLGSMTAFILMANCTFISYSLPVSLALPSTPLFSFKTRMCVTNTSE